MVRNKKRLIGITIVGLIYNISVIGTSYSLMHLINSISNGYYEQFQRNALIIVTILVLQIVVFAVYNRMKNEFTNRQMSSVRKKTFMYIFKQEMVDYYKKTEDEYISFLYNDLGFLKDKYYLRVIDIIENAMMLILAISVIVYIYPYYLLAVVLILLLSMLFPVIFSRHGKRIINKINHISKENISWFRNSLKGFKVIKAFKMEEAINNIATKRLEMFQKENAAMDILFNYIQVGLNFMMSLMMVLTFVIGGLFLNKNGLTLGALVALVQLLFNTAQPFMILATSINDINSTKEIRDKYLNIVVYKPQKKCKLNTFDYVIPLEFKNVTFRYPNSEKNMRLSR